MTAKVINSLAESGIDEFWSEYHICNRESAEWHKKFGFEEVTDISVARLRYSFYLHEVYRYEKLGNENELIKSKIDLKKVEKKLDKLLKFKENEGFAAAYLTW